MELGRKISENATNLCSRFCFKMTFLFIYKTLKARSEYSKEATNGIIVSSDSLWIYRAGKDALLSVIP